MFTHYTINNSVYDLFITLIEIRVDCTLKEVGYALVTSTLFNKIVGGL